MVVQLDEVKDHLDITKDDNDAELLTFIYSVTPVVEDYVGDIEPKTRSERHRAGDYFDLRHGPAMSVTSIADYLTDAILWTSSSVVLDVELGRIYPKDGVNFWLARAYRVNYQTGRTVVTDNVRMAAKMIVAHNWKTQRGALVRFPGSDDPQLPPGFTYSVPRKALEYLRSERRNKVVVA
jgi:hypothetical protein